MKLSQGALDPAPRKYAAVVSLVRRGNRGVSIAPRSLTYSDIEGWFLEEAIREPDLLELFESFVWRLDQVRLIPGWMPLRTGIALHAGEVFFGNIGTPERLDFTVIGRAVNEASRVESMTKALGRNAILTAPVAELLDEELDDLGEHRLRGRSLPIRLFGLPFIYQP